MRFFLFLFVFLLSFNSFSIPQTPDEDCDITRNPVPVFTSCQVDDDWEGTPNYCETRLIDAKERYPEYMVFIGGYYYKAPYNQASVFRVAEEDCGRPPVDFPTDEPPCYPDQCDNVQECEMPDGTTIKIPQTMNCGDVCQYSSGIKECGGGLPDDDYLGEGESRGPDPDWDCELNQFMCDYDTNNDGQVGDGDDPDLWPDPTEGVGSGGGCIGSGPGACEEVENHLGEDIDGDGAIGPEVGVDEDGTTGGSIIDPMDCQDVSLNYCSHTGYEAYGTGWQGNVCMDGSEEIIPRRACRENYGDDPETEETMTDTILRSIEKEAQDANLSLRGLLASMSENRQASIEAITGQTAEQIAAGESNTDRIIAAIEGGEGQGDSGGEGEGEGDSIDLNPIVDRLTSMDETLSAEVAAGTGKGFDDITSELAAAKTDFEIKFNEVKSGMDSVFQFSGGTATSLSCSSSFVVLGERFDFCINEYQEELALIGSGLIALSLIMSVFIMLGGVRV